MTLKKSIAVLISGRGSNLKALIDACAEKEYPVEIKVVISNKAEAYGLRYAEEVGIATEVIESKNYSSREVFDQALHEVLVRYQVEFICLAGFMRLLTASFVNQWPQKILNIHPSLLPAFKGLDAQKQALEAGVRVSGCTVHFVTAEMDAGPIILQEKVPVFPGDSIETLSKRILEKEHHCYAKALLKVVKGEV